MATEASPYREICERLRAQLIKEYETRKLPSGVKEEWDSVDLGERAIQYAVEATRQLCDEETRFTSPEEWRIAERIGALMEAEKGKS